MNRPRDKSGHNRGSELRADARWVEPKSVALAFAAVAVSLAVGGCSPSHGGFRMLPERKAQVIDIRDDARYQNLLDGRPQTWGMRSGRVYLQPGETCGRHSTEQHEEMLIFLAGRGIGLIGEEETAFEVGQGKVSYIPPHTIHNIKNTGTDPLVYIYCVTPVQSGAEDHPEQDNHHH
jgi:mannose-6-phosphate isomerase-like protein (cupin superfamily)